MKEKVKRIWGRSHGIRQEKIGRTKRGGRSGGEATEGKTEGEEPPRLVGTILEERSLGRWDKIEKRKVAGREENNWRK